jgi:hypothetical protein
MFSTAQCNACHPCRLGCSPTRMWHIPCWCLAQLVLPLACVCVAGRSLRGGLLGFCAAVPALEVHWPSLSAPWSAAMRSHCLVGHAVCLCNQLTSDIKFVSAQLTAGLGRSTSLQMCACMSVFGQLVLNMSGATTTAVGLLAVVVTL